MRGPGVDWAEQKLQVPARESESRDVVISAVYRIGRSNDAARPPFVATSISYPDDAFTLRETERQRS